MDSKNTFQEFKTLVKNLVSERGWEKYHNPKDLAEAICIEAAELLEIFQWATLDEAFSWRNDSSKMESIRGELADVLIYCLSMANTLIDLSDAILRKLKKRGEIPDGGVFQVRLVISLFLKKFNGNLEGSRIPLLKNLVDSRVEKVSGLKEHYERCLRTER